jgi:hypothetical protein
MQTDFDDGKLNVWLDPISLVDPDGDLTKTRSLNVVAVDTSTMEISVKYGGAYSGVYELIVVSDNEGSFDTTTNNV